MATAKKGFGLPCPPPKDDDMGYIDMRTKSRAKPHQNHNRFYFIPQLALIQKENSLSFKARLHHQLQSKATKKVYHKWVGKLQVRWISFLKKLSPSTSVPMTLYNIDIHHSL